MKKKLIIIIVIVIAIIGCVTGILLMTKNNTSDLQTIQDQITIAYNKDKYLTYDELMDKLTDINLVPKQENSHYLLNASTFKVSLVTFNYEKFNLLTSLSIPDTKGTIYQIDFSKSKINYDRKYLQIVLTNQNQKYYLLGSTPEVSNTIDDILTVKVKENNKYNVPVNETLNVKGTLLEQKVITEIVMDTIYYYYEEKLFDYGRFLNEYVTNGNSHYFFDLDLNKRYLYNEYVRNEVIPYKTDGSINLYTDLKLSSRKRAVILPGCDRVYTNAFKDCDYLESVYMPSSVEKIYENAFQTCALKELLLPENIKEIEKSAFSGAHISSVYIPKSVTKVDASAFNNLLNESTFKIYTDFDSNSVPDDVKDLFGKYRINYEILYKAYQKSLEYLAKK